jgi:hypothetical protein
MNNRFVASTGFVFTAAEQSVLYYTYEPSNSTFTMRFLGNDRTSILRVDDVFSADGEDLTQFLNFLDSRLKGASNE